MRIRAVSLIVFICIIVLTAATVFSQPYSYGRLSALKERAIAVTEQKNRFVTKVLDSYHIAYRCNQQGVVVRIKVDDGWNDVTRIEIVPLVSDESTGFRVIAHNIYFETAGGMLHLVSPLIIR
ncbi:MAG: hypothetical protein JXR85_07615 [Deltaproteobacteria bacterium]|nr:hypothetical protein [Deltaproteobacteria bacterium]